MDFIFFCKKIKLWMRKPPSKKENMQKDVAQYQKMRWQDY